jgi:hypothetical protein
MADAGIVLAPVVAGKVPTEPEEMLALRVGLQHGARPHRQTGANLDVAQLRLARREGKVEDIGLTQGDAVIDPIAQLYQRGCIGGRYCLGLL